MELNIGCYEQTQMHEKTWLILMEQIPVGSGIPIFLYMEEMVYHVVEIFIFGRNYYHLIIAHVFFLLKHTLCVEMILLVQFSYLEIRNLTLG